jgi:indole-3-glycerol phosphate synthase
MSVLIEHFEQSDLDSALNFSTKFIDILSRDLQTEEIDVIVC